MNFTQAWLSFDPEDLRTHPEEGMDVEMEFDDGRVVQGMWGIDDLFEMAHRAGVRLRLSLGVASISPENTALVRAALPSSEKAVQLYTEGRSKLWAFDFLSARDLLAKAG